MKIILDSKEVNNLVTQSLPMLIHGIEGFGSSLYTIATAEQWYHQGNKVLMLSGYPMALQAFNEAVGEVHENAIFFSKDQVNEFEQELISITEDTIVFVKNIELFEEKVFDLVSGLNNVIISGDLSKSPFIEKILAKTYTTEIYFSPLQSKEIPVLPKYEGYVISGDYTGITKVEK